MPNFLKAFSSPISRHHVFNLVVVIFFQHAFVRFFQTIEGSSRRSTSVFLCIHILYQPHTMITVTGPVGLNKSGTGLTWVSLRLTWWVQSALEDNLLAAKSQCRCQCISQREWRVLVHSAGGAVEAIHRQRVCWAVAEMVLRSIGGDQWLSAWHASLRSFDLVSKGWEYLGWFSSEVWHNKFHVRIRVYGGIL